MLTCNCFFNFHNKLPVIIDGVECFIEKHISNGIGEFRLDKVYLIEGVTRNWVDTFFMDVKCLKCNLKLKY